MLASERNVMAIAETKVKAAQAKSLQLQTQSSDQALRDELTAMRVEILKTGEKVLEAETRAAATENKATAQSMNGRSLYDKGQATIADLKFELAKANQDLRIEIEMDTMVNSKARPSDDARVKLAEESIRNCAVTEKELRKEFNAALDSLAEEQTECVSLTATIQDLKDQLRDCPCAEKGEPTVKEARAKVERVKTKIETARTATASPAAESFCLVPKLKKRR
jgi:hypothetical protein